MQTKLCAGMILANRSIGVNTENTNGVDLTAKVKQAFYFLVDDYEFEYRHPSSESDLGTYESKDFQFKLGYHVRHGFCFSIFIKTVTYWINDSIGRGFDACELIKRWNPEENIPWDSNPDEMIQYYAEKLKENGVAILKGDLSTCEDVVIMKRMSLIRGVSVKCYIELMRELSKDFPAAEKKVLESAFETEGPLHIIFTFQEIDPNVKLRSRELIHVLNQMHQEYCA